MTAPTEVTTIPTTPALARVAGIAPDGRLALQIDFADPKGNRTVIFTLEAEAVFKCGSFVSWGVNDSGA